MNKEITVNQVRNWLGSDNTLREALETLTEIANGEYPPKVLAEDILIYNDTDWEIQNE